MSTMNKTCLNDVISAQLALAEQRNDLEAQLRILKPVLSIDLRWMNKIGQNQLRVRVLSLESDIRELNGLIVDMSRQIEIMRGNR